MFWVDDFCWTSSVGGMMFSRSLEGFNRILGSILPLTGLSQASVMFHEDSSPSVLMKGNERPSFCGQTIGILTEIPAGFFEKKSPSKIHTLQQN